jgi:hypothetical protein
VLREDAILFEKLVDYQIGLPKDQEDRKKLIAQIEAAVEEMHTRGVVHLVLYVSDIMWKMIADGTCSRVRVIDFDVVHELGKPLTLNAQQAIRNGDVSDFQSL